MNTNRQNGLSLVEIMVAMVISIFLLGGVVQVYIGNKATYNFSEGMSRIQENGRFTMDIITRDLRMAGFWGCATFNSTNTTNITNNLDPLGSGYTANLHDFINFPPIQGTENDGVNGSDSITIRGATPGQTNVVSPFNIPTSADISGNNVDGLLDTDDIILLTNCKGADILQISNIVQGGGAATLTIGHNLGGSPGNFNPADCNGGHCLSQTYGADSSILKLQTVTYSIAAGESGEPALFRSLFGNNIELLEGIEQMQILYGIDTDTDNVPNQYVTSNNVANWRQVTAVRIMLLLISPGNVTIDSEQKYDFNGNLGITSNDNRLRQVFSTTIALRN